MANAVRKRSRHDLNCGAFLKGYLTSLSALGPARLPSLGYYQLFLLELAQGLDRRKLDVKSQWLN